MGINKKIWAGGELVSQAGLNQTSAEDAVNTGDNIHSQYANIVAAGHSNLDLQSGESPRTAVLRILFFHRKPLASNLKYKLLIRGASTVGGFTISANFFIFGGAAAGTNPPNTVVPPTSTVHKEYNEPTDFSFGSQATGNFNLVLNSTAALTASGFYEMSAALIVLNQ